MNMVEKVARAICSVDGNDPDLLFCKRRPNRAAWQIFERDARAAIAAMREPSEAMLDKGPGEPYMDRDVWARMIDAALAEGGGE